MCVCAAFFVMLIVGLRRKCFAGKVLGRLLYSWRIFGQNTEDISFFFSQSRISFDRFFPFSVFNHADSILLHFCCHLHLNCLLKKADSTFFTFFHFLQEKCGWNSHTYVTFFSFSLFPIECKENQQYKSNICWRFLLHFSTIFFFLPWLFFNYVKAVNTEEEMFVVILSLHRRLSLTFVFAPLNFGQ